MKRMIHGACLGLALVAMARAAEPAAPAGVDPQALAAVRRLAEHVQSARNFRFDVSLRVVSEMEGMRQEITATYAFAAERPNRLALRHVKGMAGNTVVSDGKKLFTYVGMINRYDEKDAPRSIEEFVSGTGAMAGNMLFIDNLLRADIQAGIMEGVLKATHAGRETLDGVECEHLKFVQEDFDWELWLTTGDKPMVVQVLSDMSKGIAPDDMAIPGTSGLRMTVLNRFSNWVVDAALPGDTFAFRPPAGARKVEGLFEMDEGPEEGLTNGPLLPHGGPTVVPPPAAVPPAGVTNNEPAATNAAGIPKEDKHE